MNSKVHKMVSLVLLSLIISGCFWEQARKDYLVTSNRVQDSYMTNGKGVIYSPGTTSIPAVPAEYFERMKAAALAGDVKAKSWLGQMYLTGKGTKKNIPEGVRWLSIAAEEGNASALHNLAWLTENGVGVEQDWDRAIELYERAADMKFAQSLNNLGRIYSYGLGTKKNKAKAFGYYQKAAELGLDLAKFNVAQYYIDGIVVQQDLYRAKQYLSELCIKGLPGACEQGKQLSPVSDTNNIE